MGLLGLLFRLPILPVEGSLRGTLRVLEIVADEAERELHDPARVRRDLEEAEQRHAAGEISDDELAQIENDAMARLGARVNPSKGAD
jgi:hypothetical protein